MKRHATLLFVLLISLAITANAQHRFQLQEPYHNPTSQQASTVQNKGAGIGSRLLADSHYWGTSSGTFTPSDSGRYSYPSASTNVYNQYLLYNCASGQWPPFFNYSYTYTAGALTQELIQQWNTGTNSFDNQYRYLYTNNTAGYRTNLLAQMWNTGNAAWENMTNHILTLNTANLVTSEVSQDWYANTNSFVNLDRLLYTYNNQGNVTQEIMQIWNPGPAAWINYYRYDYNYDAAGLHMNHAATFNWNTGTSAWINESQNIFTLNTAGNPTQNL